MIRHHWIRIVMAVVALTLVLISQTTAWADDKRRLVTVKPVALSAPANAWAGEWITVSWTLVNDGQTASGRNMVSRLYLSATPDMVGPTFELSRVLHQQDLEAGATMTISQQVQIPHALRGGCPAGADRTCDQAYTEAKRPPFYREVAYYVILRLDHTFDTGLVQPIQIRVPFGEPDSQP
jgi:hypothetical protein